MAARSSNISILGRIALASQPIFTLQAIHRSVRVNVNPVGRSSTPFQSRSMSSGAKSESAQAQSASPSSDGPSLSSIGVRNTNINEDSSVSLSPHQNLLVASVLDLFEGNPTLRHLSLWSRDASFQDPIALATGYDKFAAQWYGLPALFNPIKILSHQVTSAGNPIELTLSNKYVVKGVQKEQVINSVVRIHVGQDGKIEKLEDRWNDQLPDGAFAQTFRKLNAVSVPALITVPKTEEEDRKMKEERDRQN